MKRIISACLKVRTIAIAAATLSAFCAPAYAYDKSHCLGEEIKWSSNSKSLQASSTSFPSGTWFNGISDGVNKFNLNPSREIWGTTDQGVLQGAPAIAYSWWTCFWFFGDIVHMDEVDIAFDYDTPWRWTTSTNKANLIRYSDTATDLRPLQTTAAHELGHGAKLNHINSEYNVMGTDFEHIHVNGSTARAYAGEDLADGMVDLYGARESWEDLGVVHWRYSGASGEYSDHIKGQIRNSSNGVVPTFTITDPGTTREVGYSVSRGQTVRVQFTYENMGRTTQSGIDVGFYISTNDTITTFDQRIGGRTLTLSRDDVYSPDHHTVVIPSTLNSGQIYWLGAIIDEDNSVAENVEWNNATYIPIRVQ